MTHYLRSVLMTGALTVSLAGCGAAKELQGQLDAAKSAKASCVDELAQTRTALEAERGKADLAAKRLAAYRDLAKQLRDAFDDGSVTLEIRNGRLVVKVPNAILFGTGKAAVSADGKATLDKLAKVLAQVPERRFLVAGHTDDRPVKDKSTAFKTNWELSSQRALSALYYLETRKIDPKRMAAAGYGEFQPLVPNKNDAARAQNRRLEIVILPTLAEIPKMPSEI